MPNQRVFWAGGATSSMKGLLRVMMEASPAPMTTRHRMSTQNLGATAQPTEPSTHTANPKPAPGMQRHDVICVQASSRKHRVRLKVVLRLCIVYRAEYYWEHALGWQESIKVLHQHIK